MSVRLEVCAGCGIRAAAHPFVAVMSVADASAASASPLAAASDRGFVSVPVCAACHADPEHRSTPLKAHFFDRVAAGSAQAAAGRNPAAIGG